MVFNLKKDWKKILPIIGIGIFIYLIIKINVFLIFEEILQVKIVYLIGALLFLFLMFITLTLKWFIIAKKQNIDVKFLYAVKITIITIFYNFILPSKLGTIIRLEYLKKYMSHRGKGLCNFTIEKVLDLASIIFIVILFSFIFKDKLEIPIFIFIFIFIAFVILTFFFVKKERSKFIFKFIYRFLPRNLKSLAKNNFDSFYENMPKKRYFALFFIINILNWIIIFFIYYLIGLSLGINLTFIYYLGIIPLGTLVSLLPISINGLGTREATLISLFALFGISSVKVFSMSILSMFLTGVIPSIIAIFLIFKKSK